MRDDQWERPTALMLTPRQASDLHGFDGLADKIVAPVLIADKEMYKKRHTIKNFFSRLKDFRGIATRYDKTTRP